MLSHHDVTVLLLATAVLLGAARLLGELAQRYRQPAVLGELLAGIFLGPTVFGALMPDVHAALFPPAGPAHDALQGISTLAVTLFLLVAGLEIDLSMVLRQGKAALAVGFCGLALPFACGFAAAWLEPQTFGAEIGANRIAFALFFATALSITALPVIAKILLDLNLFRSEVGVTIIAAAILNDLAGWLVFALVLSLIGHTGGASFSVASTAALTVLFAALMLTAGRWLVNRILPLVQAHTAWPAGVLGFVLTGTLMSAAFTAWIGIHAVFGAFLFGVAAGDSQHLRQRTRATIDQFISFIFAPLFFASIGLRVDFAEHFDPALTALVVFLCFACKVSACTAAARWMRFPRREALAVGFGMLASGAMGIILGLLALEAGIIGERLFVSLVALAMITSMTSGTLMERVIGVRKGRHLADLLHPRNFLPRLGARTRYDALDALGPLAAAAAGLDRDEVIRALRAREDIVTSAIGHGVAVPHARFPGLKQPAVAVGLSAHGIDFDAADGEPVRVVIAMLTPAEDVRVQLDLMADIAQTFRREGATRRLAEIGNLTEFRALLNIERPRG